MHDIKEPGVVYQCKTKPYKTKEVDYNNFDQTEWNKP